MCIYQHVDRFAELKTKGDYSVSLIHGRGQFSLPYPWRGEYLFSPIVSVNLHVIYYMRSRFQAVICDTLCSLQQILEMTITVFLKFY